MINRIAFPLKMSKVIPIVLVVLWTVGTPCLPLNLAHRVAAVTLFVAIE